LTAGTQVPLHVSHFTLTEELRMSVPPHPAIDVEVAPRRLDPTEVRRHAREGDPAAVLACLVQMTGDLSHVDRFGPHLQSRQENDGRLLPRMHLPEQQWEALLDEVAKASAAGGGYRQSLSDEDFLRVLRTVVGQEVDEEFTGIVREQAGFVSSMPAWRTEDAPTADFRVAVLGAGMAGIAAGIALTDAGFAFEIYEQAEEIGGTWRINRYPGVAVDTPSIYYSYSFELEASWSKYYPLGAEYQRYLHRVVDKYDLEHHIRFGTRIWGLAWDEKAQEWIVESERDGVVRTERYRAVITAAGFLNRPKVPDLPGLSDFRGRWLHSAEWPQDLDLRGKRVGVVGAGATSVQVVDAVIGDVEHLTLFQRQPHWVMPNHLGEGLVPDSERWLQEHLPFYDRWQRAKQYWFTSDVLYDNVRADKEWMAEHELSISSLNDMSLQLALSHLKESFGHDPELLAAMTPDFAPHGKRIIRDPGGYYAALAGDKASVVTTGLKDVTPNGLRTEDGQEIELDVIVFATGFTLDFLSTLDIVGRDGTKLAEQWAGHDPRSYLGGTVPGFPNLFITSGPNSSSGHGGGHNFMTEVVLHYIMECLQLMVARGARSMEVRKDAHDTFVAEVDAQMEGSVWRTSLNAHTYYRNEAGRVFLPNPWRMVDYWQMLREPDTTKFEIR
jgi:cation diffusion facilitator CzcD-associated flavoprotein CzcO